MLSTVTFFCTHIIFKNNVQFTQIRKKERGCVLWQLKKESQLNVKLQSESQ